MEEVFTPPPPHRSLRTAKILLIVAALLLSSGWVYVVLRSSPQTRSAATGQIPTSPTPPAPTKTSTPVSPDPDKILEQIFANIKNGNRSALNGLLSPRAKIDAELYKSLYNQAFTTQTTYKFVETSGAVVHYTVVVNGADQEVHRLILLNETGGWLLVDDEVSVITSRQ